MILIGYPFAGRAFTFPQSSTYHLMASGLRVGIGQIGDITGNQGTGHGARVVRDELGTFTASLSSGRAQSTLFKLTRRGKGKGAHFVRQELESRAGARGKVLGKQARSVGVAGLDRDLDQSARLARWLAPMREPSTFWPDVQRLESFGAVVFLPSRSVLDESKAARRAAIVASVDREEFAGREILSIANRAAHKQAERLEQLRGVRASVTSIEEACAAAVSGMLAYEHEQPDGARVQVQRRLDKVSIERWQSGQFRRVLHLFAGRAAFKSLCAWANTGTTGDNTHKSTGFSGRGFVDEFTTELADQLSVSTWRRDDPIWFDSQRGARWSLARWIYRVGYRQFSQGLTGKGAGRARQAALSRCRVIGSLIFGASMADACGHAGFASVDNWIESCKGARLFPALREARRAELASMPGVLEARQQMRVYALQAAQATRAMRAASGLWSQSGDTVGRSVRVASGASSLQPGPIAAFSRVVRPAHSRTLRARGARGTGPAQAGFVWRHAADTRERALDLAKLYRDQAMALIADNLASFDRCLAGLHSGKFGDLRAVFGMVDKRGRVRSRKADASLITRARGKVSRKPRLAPTVQVQVGSRSLACVPSVSVQSWQQSGDCGFAIVRQRNG